MNLRLPISYTTAFLSKVSILSKVTLFVFVLGFSWGLQAQTTDNYPVQTTAYCAAPFSQRLSDYFSSDKRLIVNLLLKDLTKPSVQVYLRWQLEGPGIRIGSRDGFVPASFISLQPGVPSKLSGADLAGAYFFPAALQAEGMDVVDAYNLSLPEGFYTISVQAFEASTGQVVSNTSVTFLVLTSPQPPILNLPAIGSQISATSLQKVVFQWTPRHFATAESQVVYQLKVCQVPDDSEPNEQIMLSCTEPRLELTVPNTTLTGDITQWIKPLEVGQRYGVQVRAIDLAGQLNNFSNEGYSQVHWFRYGQPCVPPIFSIKSVSSDRVQLQWQAVSQAQSYLVEYQAEGDVSWTTLKTTATTQVVSELLSRQRYLFRMRTDCGSLVPSEASEVQRWNIAEEAPEPSPQLPIELQNPELIKVQTSGGVAQTPTSLPDLYHNFPVSNSAQLRIAAFSAPTTTTLQIPDCALASGSFADCQRPHPSVGLPTGGEELGSLKVGDVLGIYDFAVFVTKVKSGPGLAGEGLVRLPFLGNAMTLVEFEGVKAKKAQPSDNGGCVYEVSGFFRVKANVTAQELAQQQQSLVERLLKESDPTVFAGTFEQALTLYDQTVAKLGTQSLTSVQAQPLLIQYLGAILQGSEQLKQQLSELGSSNPAVVTLLGDLQKLMDGLQSQLTTLKTTTQTPTVAGLEGQYEAIFERIKQLGHTPEVPIENPQSGQLSNVEVSKVSFNSAHLSWQGSGSIKRYAVVYQIPTLGELTLNTTDSQVELSNLQAGSNYTFRVIGYGADGQVLDSYGPALFATPAKTLPAPENLTYTVLDDHSVKISWAKNSLHQRFKLSYQDANGETRTLYPSTNSAIIQGLTPDQLYLYDIVAYGTVGSENIASTATTSDFKLGTVCYTTLSSSAQRIMEGASVVLTLEGCQNGMGQDGVVKWYLEGNPTAIFEGSTLTYIPRQTTTFSATCNLTRSDGTEESCSPSPLTVTVDKKCTGVVATVSPTTIEKFGPYNREQQQPPQQVTLSVSGCSGEIQWLEFSAYGVKTVGNKTITVITPSNNVGPCTYKAHCTNGNSNCISNAGTVDVKCNFKIHVWNSSQYSYILSKQFKTVYVRTVGCGLGQVEWETIGGNSLLAEDLIDNTNAIKYTNIRKPFTVKARCKTTGCEVQIDVDVPPNSNDCDPEKFKIAQTWNEKEQNHVLTVQDNGLSFVWDDNNSAEKVRKIPPSQFTNVFAITSSKGCKASVVVYPIVATQSSSAPPSVVSIPCALFEISASSTQVPYYSASGNIIFTVSGCNSPSVGDVKWQWMDAGGTVISSGTSTTSVAVPISDSDVGKAFTFSGICSLTGEKKELKVNITKQARPELKISATSGEIPFNKTSTTITMTVTGCVGINPEKFDWEWKDGKGNIRTKGSSVASEVKIQVTDSDASQNFTFVATCPVSNTTKSLQVWVKKQIDPLHCLQKVEFGKTYYYDPCQMQIEAKGERGYEYFYKIGEVIKFKVRGVTSIDKSMVYQMVKSIVKPANTVGFLDVNFIPEKIDEENCEVTFVSISPVTSTGFTGVEITNTGIGKSCKQTLVFEVTNSGTPEIPVAGTSPTPKSKEQNCTKYAQSSYTGGYRENIFVLSALGLIPKQNIGIVPIHSSNQLSIDIPKNLGLVDKVCINTPGALVQWYTNVNRKPESQLPYWDTKDNTDKYNSSYEKKVGIVPYPSSGEATYYGRCVFSDGNYCETTIKFQQSLNNQRSGVSEENLATNTESSSQTNETGTERPCIYSEKEAAKVLLTNMLCSQPDFFKNNEAFYLNALKTWFAGNGIQLANISDQMVAQLKSSNCQQAVNELIATINPDKVSKVDDLEQIISQSKIDELTKAFQEEVFATELINTDFNRRTIIGPAISSPVLRVEASACPAYYFSPVGKRIYIPNISNCSYSINGVLMQFEKDGSLYIPLWLRSSNAFAGYFKKDVFVQKSTPTGEADVRIAKNTDMVALTGLERPDELSGLERWKAFMTTNKALITNATGEFVTDAEFTTGMAQLTPTLAAFEDTPLFERVEKFKAPYGPYLFNLDDLKAELTQLKGTTDEQIVALKAILSNPAYDCGGLGKDAPTICKVYQCVYNTLEGTPTLDILNARLDLATRKQLITILARDGSLTSGLSPVGGCAFTANGEATILSLIRTTPENDVMPILAHLQADLNGKPLLQTLIDKVDLGALVAAITYVEKSSINAVNAYASLDENDPNLAPKVNERIIPIYDNDLYTKDFEGKIRYTATYQNGAVKIERQVYGCTLTEKSDGAGDYVWVPDCKFTLEASYSLSPYDMVSINNLSRLSAIENDLDISTNGIADLPALALVYISQQQTSNKTWQAINLAGTVVGSGGVLIAYRAGKLAIAALEAASVLGSMGQDGINMGLIPAEYQNGIANYNLIAGGLGLTAGATTLPKLGTLAVQQVRSGLSSAISRVNAQRFLDAFEGLKNNTAQWAALGSSSQGRIARQKLTNLANYLLSKGMKAGQVVESGLLAASAVKRWGQKTATGLVLLTNMFVVNPAVLARGGDMVEAVTKVEAKVGFKANGVVLKNDIPTSFAPISVRGATPLETVPSVLQEVGIELADDIATDGTLLNATLQQGSRQVTMQQASVGDYLLLQLGIAGLGTVYLAQKNPTSDECSICKGIIINGQNRNEVCKSLEALAAKAGLSYKTIIEDRLCKSALSNLRLAEVATQLTAYSQTEVQAFLRDINGQNNIVNAPNNTRSISHFVNNLRIASLNAWKQCKDARPNSAGIRLDWDVLESVANYQTSGSIKAQLTIGGVDRYLKMLPGTDGYSGQCNTCTPGSQPVCERLPMMHVYLNSLKDFAVKYGSKTDFNKFITGEATASGLNKQDGAYHLMRDLNNRSYTAGTVVSFEGSISSKMQGFAGTILCNGCSYDVEKAGNVLVDYKSYDCRTGIKEDQFKQYLQYWNNDPIFGIRTFEYVFNSEKITLEEAKKKFVTLLKSDPAGYYSVNPAFFNRITLADGITPISNVNEFIVELNKTNFWQKNIFNFITIVP